MSTSKVFTDRAFQGFTCLAVIPRTIASWDGAGPKRFSVARREVAGYSALPLGNLRWKVCYNTECYVK